MAASRLRPALSALLLLPMATALRAQPTEDDRAISVLVRERCPSADILRIERSPSGLIEAEYLCGTEVLEAGILNGRVVYEERQVRPAEEVMERIRAKAAKQYPDWLIDEVNLVTTADTAFLKVELMLDGVEQNLFFTTAGRAFKPSALLVSDKWTLAELRALEPPGLGYDLLRPDTVHELPPLLREVSGIAVADARTVLCVQDELGAVFTYDLADDRITDLIRFTDLGDFEDIALHGDRISVLRSDGWVADLDRRSRAIIRERMPALPSLNHEGLYIDARTGDRMIVSKEAPLAGPPDARQVHRLRDDGRAELHRTLSAKAVTEALAARYPSLARHGVRFQPSAAEVHPLTGQLYVLSASDRLLVAYDGDAPRVAPLPAELFYKPEGLAFLPNGDLLISSEGDKKGLVKPSILRFGYRSR